MAWQLIYTSSPRLLEAGRTGFGTVAKHRDISGVLTGKLESISQFARLAGYNPDRIIYTHRILEAGSRSYHVLSCIQNAGSDYSGRTNHIAHHLIVHAEEVASLSQRGVTPLDILYLMEWRTNWEGNSRFLDSTEEVDLSNSIAHNFSVWSTLTGKPDHSRLPWSPEAAKGCYVLVPQHVDARYILGETMIHNVAKSWDMTFTTHLEPNDGLGDFRWICLPPDSPARSQVDVSARPVYDLLHPDFLPVPPAPIKAAVHSPIPKQTIQYTLKPPAPTDVADKASSWGMEMLAPQRPAQRAVPALPLKHVPLRELPMSRKKLPALTLVLVTLGILVVGFAFWQQWEKQQKQVAEDKDRLKTEIANLWKNHGLKMTQTLEYLKKAVDDDTTPDLSEANDLLTEATDLLNAAKMRLTEDRSIETRKSFKLSELNSLEDEIESWYGAKKTVSNRIELWLGWQSLHQALIEEEKKWNALITNYASAPQKVREKWHIGINTLVTNQLASKDNKPEDYAAAKKVIDLLGVKVVPEPDWLKDWEQISKMKIGERLGTEEYAKMLGRKPPEWLQTELDKRKPPGDSKPAPPTTILATSSMMQSPKVAVAGNKSAANTAILEPSNNKSPVFITDITNLDNLQDDTKSPKLPLVEGMLIETKNLEHPFASIRMEPLTLKKKLTDEYVAKPTRASREKDGLVFRDTRLRNAPIDGSLTKDGITIVFLDGFRLIGLSGPNENKVFELIVLVGGNSRTSELVTEITGKIETIKPGTYSLQLENDLANIHWNEPSKVRYYIRLTSDQTNKNDIELVSVRENSKKFGIKPSETTGMAPVKDIGKLKRELQIIEQGLRSLQQDSDNLVYKPEYKKLAPEEQARRRTNVANGISEKTKDLEDKKTEIAEAEKKASEPLPPPPRPKEGRYILLAQNTGVPGGSPIRVCYITLK